mgnify:CR=1 FL=1
MIVLGGVLNIGGGLLIAALASQGFENIDGLAAGFFAYVFVSIGTVLMAGK